MRQFGPHPGHAGRVAGAALCRAEVQGVATGRGDVPAHLERDVEQAQALAGSLQLRFEKRDAKRQMFVSRWANSDPGVFPAPFTVGLQDSDQPVRVQFHVMVASGRDSARAAAGTIVEIERRVDGRTNGAFGHRVGTIEEWFLHELDARAGVEHERMAATFEARREQAAGLMPPTRACRRPRSGRAASSRLPSGPATGSRCSLPEGSTSAKRRQPSAPP